MSENRNSKIATYLMRLKCLQSESEANSSVRQSAGGNEQSSRRSSRRSVNSRRRTTAYRTTINDTSRRDTTTAYTAQPDTPHSSRRDSINTNHQDSLDIDQQSLAETPSSPPSTVYEEEDEMATVDSVVSLYRDLKSEWNKKAPNLKKCGTLVDQLKIALIKLSYLPTGSSSAANQKDLKVARDSLEIAVEYSVAVKDIPAFERYMSQLKCYYYDYKNLVGESQNMYKLLGLNLLYLLSVNRVSEFHTELELLPAKVIQTNEFIRPILALEQYIMEGRYNKIFEAKNSAPSDSYNFFMDILLETVRDEIGGCIEKSYEKISAAEAAKRLNLKTVEEVQAFGQKKNWSLGPDGTYYFVTKSAKPKEPLPSVELAEQAIFYARELEMIV